ncbi:MAG: hypothetical protein Q9187_008075 [Circinaria calcarea]
MVEFSFSSLADEDDRSVKLTQYDAHNWYSKKLFKILKLVLATRPQDYWANLPQLVHLRQFVNDTEVSGFKIDYSEVQISCDWRGLLTALPKEEKRVNRASFMCERSEIDSTLDEIDKKRELGQLKDACMGRMDIEFSEDEEGHLRVDTADEELDAINMADVILMETTGSTPAIMFP